MKTGLREVASRDVSDQHITAVLDRFLAEYNPELKQKPGIEVTTGAG